MIALLLSLLLQVAQTPEEMYREYISPEAQALLDRTEQIAQESAEAESAARTKKTLILVFSLAVGLIPPVYIGTMAVKGKTWKENPGGTAKGLAIGVLGGAVLFGLNYGVLMLKLRMGNDFNTAFAFVLVAAMIIGAIYLLKKK